jgi:multiple sugar transport system permease protein
MAWLWFAPVLVLLMIVMVYPTMSLVWMSLHEMKFFQTTKCVGFQNYKDVMSSDGFSQLVSVSFMFVGGTLVLALTIGLGTALLVQSLGKRTSGAVRTVLLLPWTLSMTVVGCLWLWLLNPSYGPVKFALSKFNVQSGLMLGNPDAALPLVIIAAAWWSFPYAMVLIAAALQSVPKELYNAVDIDGGAGIHRFRYVTWPHVAPTLGSTGLALAITYFTLVSLIIVMTGGGPLGATTTFSFAIFKETVQSVDISPAAVISMIILFANIVLGVIYKVVAAKSRHAS